MSPTEYTRDRFEADFLQAVVQSGTPSPDVIRKAIDFARANPDSVPESTVLYPIHFLARLAIHSLGLPIEWFSNDLIDNSILTKTLAEIDGNAEQMDAAFNVLKSVGKTSYECKDPKITEPEDKISIQLFRNAVKKLNEMIEPASVSEIENIKIEVLYKEKINLPGVHKEIIVGNAFVKIRGVEHRCFSTINVTDLAF